MSSEVQLHRLLSQAARRLLWRHGLFLHAAHLAAVSVLLAVLALLDAVLTLREGTAGPLLLAVLAVSMISLVYGLWRNASGRRFTAVSLAREVEREAGDFHDALVCAVELEEREDALNGLEALLLARVRTRFAAEGAALLARVCARRPLWRPCVLGVAAAVMFVTLAALTPGGRKAGYWLAGLLTGWPPGLEVLAPAPRAAFMVRSDITVTAKVHRWEREAVIEYLGDEGTVEHYPMHAVPNGAAGEFTFTLFEVMRDGRFRVLTPSLATDWQTYRVFERPQLKDVEVTAEPPAYTGLPSQKLTDFQDLTVVTGTALQFTATLLNGTGLTLQTPQAAQLFTAATAAEQSFTLSLTAEESGPCEVQVTGLDGGRQALAQFTLTVLPDLPPVVERREPTDDVKLKPNDTLRLSALATDDFGLRSFRLEYRIIGREGEVRELAAGAGGAREADVDEIWDVPALGVKEGDMISCMLVAADNRLPLSQVTRNGPFFVSIVPDTAELKAPANGQSQEEETVDMSAVIAESKRLLRQSWELSMLASPPENLLDDTAVGLQDLGIEIARRQTELQEKTKMPALPEPFGSLFKTAVDELAQAVGPLRKRSFEPSIRHQENALAQLLRIENELAKNKAKSDQAKAGKKNSGKKDGEEEQKQQPQADEEGEDGTAQALEEAIAKLRQAVARQDTLNSLLRRGDGSREAQEQEQRDIRTATRDVDLSLKDVAPAQPARALLGGAQHEMTGAANSVRHGRLPEAAIHGTRAGQQLLEALSQLESIRRQLGQQQVRQLAQEASSLAERQQAAARESAALQEQKAQGQLDDARRQQARQEQEALSAKTAALEKKLGKTAQSLEAMSPETAAELENLARQLAQGEVRGHQKKASNALLYKRFEKAVPEQEAAAQQLSELAQSVGQTAAKMPGFTLEELREQLQKLQEAAEAVREAQRSQDGQKAEQAVREARKEGADAAGRLARMLHDRRLEEVAGRLSEELDSQNFEQGAAEALSQLGMSLRLAVEALRKLEGGRATVLQRESVQPPGKYRRLVEEYFKGLGQ